MVEQRVDRATGNITVWYDGLQVMSRAGVLGGVTGVPFSGIFFSTFFVLQSRFFGVWPRCRSA